MFWKPSLASTNSASLYSLHPLSMSSSSPASNIQIEQAVLGAMLIDADVMSLVRPADFFDPVNAVYSDN